MDRRHQDAPSTDRVKAELRDFISGQVTELVEYKVDAQRKRSMVWINSIVMVAVLMMPAAWFLIEGLIRHAVENLSDEVAANLSEKEKELKTQMNQIEDAVQKELLFIKVSNAASQLSLRSYIPTEQVKSLMETLETVSKVPAIKDRPEFIDVLDRIVHTFVRYGYEDYLHAIVSLFPDLIDKSEDINSQLLFFYGRRVLAKTHIDSIKNSLDFQRMEQYVRTAELHKKEQNSLSIKALAHFHLAHDKRDPIGLDLIRSAAYLGIKSRAQFLWYVIQNTNPQFWQNNPSPLDHRVAKITNQFVTTYKSELDSLASTNGVKETLLKFYDNANMPEDVRLAKHVLYFFYKVSAD